jgi:hypothetical protein
MALISNSAISNMQLPKLNEKAHFPILRHRSFYQLPPADIKTKP